MGTSSGITYIHELESVLSSIFLPRNSFSLLPPSNDQYHSQSTNRPVARNSHFLRAFTLIELIVVLAIIAILMSMAYPMYTGISERAKATKDLSNLRQIGIATQIYMNDSDGVLPGSITPPTTWMSQLLKYTSVWGIFQSPFDKRPRSEAGNDATPVSYGINFKVYINNAPIPATRISKPTAFILFAPAQNNSATVAFQGTGNTAAPGVNLLGAYQYRNEHSWRSGHRRYAQQPQTSQRAFCRSALRNLNLDRVHRHWGQSRGAGSVDSVHSVPVAAVEIRGAGYCYTAFVGSDLIENIGKRVRKRLSRETCAIISDTNVGPLFASRVKRSLTSAGFKPTLITIPAGEKSKTLEQASTICGQMTAAGLDRQSFVIGVGGGVIGDISGFVAAIYHRGIPHVQIPTTLLAMVDSSIGGKTGVNTRAGKNLIGAFHHPSVVIDDVDVLKTLPCREFNQGFAEIIKHAIIADAKMFKQLQSWEARSDASRLPSSSSFVVISR